MAEESSAALADALRWLKVAERTTAELREALLKKHSPEEVEKAVIWLSARKLVSDQRAVEATVRPRTTGRRAEGDARLRERLEARGADDQAIEAALADAPNEVVRMNEALAMKFRSKDPADRGRAGRFLLSRGFDEDAVDGALDRYFNEE